MSGLVYEPLNLGQNEIRVLRLVHDGHEPPCVEKLSPFEFPKFSLHRVSLDDFTIPSRVIMGGVGKDSVTPEQHVQFREILKNAPPEERPSHLWDGRWKWGDFRAISYVCGEPSNSKKVIVNGTLVGVTDNLYDILEYLWLGYGPTVELADPALWVDALCINQQDLNERSQEVRRMGKIYGQALQTISWVGGEVERIQHGINFIRSMITEIRDVCQDPFDEPIPLSAILDVLDRVDDQQVLGFSEIITSDYWTRLWVLQEVHIGQDNISFAGRGYELSHLELYLTIKAFQQSYVIDVIEEFRSRCQNIGDHVGRAEFMIGVSRVKHMVNKELQWDDVIDMMRTVSHLEQSDRRDRIYAILSLLPPRLAAMIHPNYRDPVAKVFSDFNQALIKYTEKLDVISLGQITAQAEEDLNLPGWVPDWGSEWDTRLDFLRRTPFRACGDTLAQVSPSQGTHLSAKGFIIDACDSIAKNLRDIDAEVVSAVDPADLKFEAQLNTRNLNAYRTVEGTREALWRTMVANRSEDSVEPPQAWETLLRVPWRSEDLNWDAYDHATLYEVLRHMNCALRIGGVSLKKYYTPLESETELYRGSDAIIPARHMALGMAYTYRLAVTQEGYLGLVPQQAQKGDKICIFLGCSVPLLLRPVAGTEHWQLIGNCYIHGVMEGEAMVWLQDGRWTVKDFEIC